MQQIMERQKVVDEYRSMMLEGMGLIPLESNLYKSALVVILHTIQIIEVDKVWHLKTFRAVLMDLQRGQDEEIHKQKDMSIPCTENGKTNSELDGKEVIYLSSNNRSTTSELHGGGESTNKESQDKVESKTIARLESKTRSEKDN